MTKIQIIKPYGLIYEAYNTHNGKRYIGQTTTTLKKRIQGHYDKARKVKNKQLKYNFPLGNAINKYGKLITWRVVKYCYSKKELDNSEIYYIAHYNTCNNIYGYNIRAGGDNGGKHSEQTKEKIRQKSLQQTNVNTKKAIEWNKKNGGPANKIKFTQEQKDQIILMRFQKIPVKVIATYFGCNNKRTIGRIIKNIYFNGVSLNDPFWIKYLQRLEITESVIQKYSKENMTITEIAKQCGTSCKPISKIIKEYKLCRN